MGFILLCFLSLVFGGRAVIEMMGVLAPGERDYPVFYLLEWVHSAYHWRMGTTWVEYLVWVECRLTLERTLEFGVRGVIAWG
ncbi:uncharacterized protein GGS22DRAFT_153816 [Annulohypoxylon maeteangense]|uniref:uncharacterized protein n=1 Tax=Annulohypoxylon maeteangense TaxID=1927788 RepID=UPI0020088713|nr:uncharacterized protein GGS22DRAFT_153816 [Annulohypoxylon maeteangense]KAI0889408.1 hypothetical protein GGS22DRAFT_153816 [Annulohypoxylon maeteangense]